MDYSLKRADDVSEEASKKTAVGGDDELVKAAQKNKAAFTPLYRRYAERVYRYVISRVGNATEAEDLTSQVFEDALASLPGYRPKGRFAGWLFTLAYRRCADYHRQPAMEALSEQLSTGPFQDPVEQTVQRETFHQLERILAGLSDEERELLRLHYAAGLSYREMADVLNRSEGALKMAMSRLIQKMSVRWEVQDD